uniref:Activating transcription factor of chaperone like n=1 Tax=Alectorobius mimon TaxID=360319 RepID=A0A147B7N3_9ACAR
MAIDKHDYRVGKNEQKGIMQTIISFEKSLGLDQFPHEPFQVTYFVRDPLNFSFQLAVFLVLLCVFDRDVLTLLFFPLPVTCGRVFVLKPFPLFPHRLLCSLAPTAFLSLLGGLWGGLLFCHARHVYHGYVLHLSLCDMSDNNLFLYTCVIFNRDINLGGYFGQNLLRDRLCGRIWLNYELLHWRQVDGLLTHSAQAHTLRQRHIQQVVRRCCTFCFRNRWFWLVQEICW